MAFDAEAYRREAKALGLSDADIEADIAEEMAGSQGQFAEPTAESVSLNKDNVIPGWLQPAMGAAAIGAAGVGAKTLYDRYIGGSKRAGGEPRIEPQMDVSQKAPEGRVEPTWEPKQVIQQANATNPEVPVVKTGAQAAQEAVAAGQLPAKGLSPATSQDIEILANAAKAKTEKEIAKAGIKPPEQKTFATEADLKAKMPEAVFKAGLGPGDNWLYNTYGAEGRKAILNQFNEGKPIGGYKEAVELSKKAQQVTAGPQIPRDVAKTRGIAPTETNYGKLGKVGKVAGVAGLLMTAAEAANAAQKKDYGKVVDLLSDLFVLPFAQSTELSSGTLDSEEARKIRAQAIGGGRGVTPASAYQR